MAARTTTARNRIKPRVPPRDGFLGRVLDPIDRLSETIYSVLILLTFTLAYRIIRIGAEPVAPPDSIRYANELLIASLGAILAWGVIDGLMHILMEIFQRGERHRLLQMIQTAPSDAERVDILADEFDYVLEPITDEHERDQLYKGMLAHLRSAQPRPIGVKHDDLTGALGTVAVALIAVIPSLIPIVLLRSNYDLAIRVSNIISFIVLFQAGFTWGRYTGVNPWRTGLTLVAAGVVMVAIAIPLGG